MQMSSGLRLRNCQPVVGYSSTIPFCPDAPSLVHNRQGDQRSTNTVHRLGSFGRCGASRACVCGPNAGRPRTRERPAITYRAAIVRVERTERLMKREEALEQAKNMREQKQSLKLELRIER